MFSQTQIDKSTPADMISLLHRDTRRGAFQTNKSIDVQDDFSQSMLRLANQIVFDHLG